MRCWDGGEQGRERDAGGRRDWRGWWAVIRALCHDGRVDETRVDKWLWGVRMYATRSMATDACHGGHVKVNGKTAKPATTVRVGDRVTAHVHGRERDLEVVRVIDKRVGAAVAAECLVDHSPPPPDPELDSPMFVRDRASGRPTKRDRRQLDKFRRT